MDFTCAGAPRATSSKEKTSASPSRTAAGFRASTWNEAAIAAAARRDFMPPQRDSRGGICESVVCRDQKALCFQNLPAASANELPLVAAGLESAAARRTVTS